MSRVQIFIWSLDISNFSVMVTAFQNPATNLSLQKHGVRHFWHPRN